MIIWRRLYSRNAQFRSPDFLFLMAWIRTATSLITFGFTIYKFFSVPRGTRTWSGTQPINRTARLRLVHDRNGQVGSTHLDQRARSPASGNIQSFTLLTRMRRPALDGPKKSCRLNPSGSSPRVEDSTARHSPGAIRLFRMAKRWPIHGRVNSPGRIF